MRFELMKALSHRALNPAPLAAREIPLIVILFQLGLKNLSSILVMAKARYVELKLVSRKRKREDCFYRSEMNRLNENRKPPHPNKDRDRPYKW